MYFRPTVYGVLEPLAATFKRVEERGGSGKRRWMVERGEFFYGVVNVKVAHRG